MHERAFSAFYDTLYTYAAPGLARDRRVARKALEPTYRALRVLTDELEMRGLEPRHLPELDTLKARADQAERNVT